MVEEPHTLSLLIRAPIVDDQTNKVSWPVLSWLYDTDLEISLEEAEEEFGLEIEIFLESASDKCISAISYARVQCRVWV